MDLHQADPIKRRAHVLISAAVALLMTATHLLLNSFMVTVWHDLLAQNLSQGARHPAGRAPARCIRRVRNLV